MFASTFKLNIIVITVFFIQVAHGDDLAIYGKACLTTETELYKREKKLDQLATLRDSAQKHEGRISDFLARYEKIKKELETSLQECHNTTPNSAYCHKVRQEYNELTYLIQKAKSENADDFLIYDNSALNYEIAREDLNNDFNDFYASCRDSDRHYEFIRDSEAYGQVCNDQQAKHSLTCSF